MFVIDKQTFVQSFQTRTRYYGSVTIVENLCCLCYIDRQQGTKNKTTNDVIYVRTILK